MCITETYFEINKYFCYQQTVFAWSSVFRVAAGLYVIEIALYSLWGSGEQQPWATGDGAEAVPLRAQEPEIRYDGESQPVQTEQSQTPSPQQD